MPKFQTTDEIGIYGEKVARAFVRQHGYSVLTSNYKTTLGEIDMVCRKGNMLVFIEVKTRSNAEFGRPVEAINANKREALRRASRRYLELLKREDILYRYDAVEVTYKTGEAPICTLIEDLFA